jgi:16S rRNA processing protein RimM
MKNYFAIGKLVATFGFRGEMIMKQNLGKKTSLKGLESIFLEENKDQFIPYFIQSTKIKNDDEIYITIEGYDTKEKAAKLLQKQVWMSASDFEKFSGKSAPISFLGYRVINNGKELGEIHEVIEQPHQMLCNINIAGKEVLIPLHEETLRRIDKKKRTIEVELPEGLLEVFGVQD